MISPAQSGLRCHGCNQVGWTRVNRSFQCYILTWSTRLMSLSTPYCGLQFQLFWPSFSTSPACLSVDLGGRLVVWLLLICALRAAFSVPLQGSFGSIIMTVLNRRVSRCHWKSINTHLMLVLFLLPILVARWPQFSVVLAQEKHQLHFQ